MKYVTFTLKDLADKDEVLASLREMPCVAVGTTFDGMGLNEQDPKSRWCYVRLADDAEPLFFIEKLNADPRVMDVAIPSPRYLIQ